MRRRLFMGQFQTSLLSSFAPDDAFNYFIDELQIHFLKQGIQFDDKENGLIKKDNEILGKITKYVVGHLLSIEWISPNEGKGDNLHIDVVFEPHNSGTLILFEPKNFKKHFDNDEQDMLGWYIDKVLVDLFTDLEPGAFGDWKTDRTTRRPTGFNARKTYGDPLFHWPNFYYLLEKLKLSPSDYLLELGCGGGVFLREALKSGCKAAGLDHSPEMVRLARNNNLVSVENGKLEVIYKDAEEIPFNDNKFSKVVMTGVFQFIHNPEEVLKEVLRVLMPKGNLIIYGGSKAMKGTPAAPEPYASRLRFYENEELQDMASKIGFSKVEVVQPDLRDYAKKVGIPDEHLSIFESKYSLVLLATK